jgi:hypothetical protein
MRAQFIRPPCQPIRDGATPKTVAETTRQGYAGTDNSPLFYRFNFLTIRGLQTASAIGDDTLQKQTQGYVVPDAFTHGSADQRRRWFTTGLKAGAVDSCNTFSVAEL